MRDPAAARRGFGGVRRSDQVDGRFIHPRCWYSRTNATAANLIQAELLYTLVAEGITEANRKQWEGGEV